VPKLTRPDAEEVRHLARGFLSMMAPPGGPTELQTVLVEAICVSMTGHAVDARSVEPIDARGFAEGLADRDLTFRTRALQVGMLGALTLRPLPIEVADRFEQFAAELGVEEGMLAVARRYAAGQLGLAAVDFDRNGYTADWSADRAAALHTSGELASAWAESVADPALAARWHELAACEEGSLGLAVHRLYEARGFSVPGEPGSAPPLLAQHDWVHVVADFGTTVDAELEVFAFIARANDDLRGFSLLAMVVSLFETGYLRTGAGLFESYPGQLSRDGVALRVADAMRRGALARTAATTNVDFLAIDWFTLAGEPLEVVRGLFGIRPKAERAIAAGSCSPFEPGGISEFQDRHGRAVAEAAGRDYDSFGATVAAR
jgi:hypothetical protein